MVNFFAKLPKIFRKSKYVIGSQLATVTPVANPDYYNQTYHNYLL